MSQLLNIGKIKIPFLENGVRLPEFEPSENQWREAGFREKPSNLEFFTQLCRIGWKNKIVGKISKEQELEYAARVKEETSLFEELGFTDYILQVWDVCSFADKNGIPRGPGRGSVGSSLCCYLLGITELDSVKYETFFTRFVSKSRAKYKIIDGVKYIDGSLAPDVDGDYCYFRRSEIIDYINKKYPGRTCKLLTSGTLSSKILIKDILKHLEEANEETANAVSNLIEKNFGIPEEISDALSDDPEKFNEKFKKWAEDHKETCQIAMKLSGLIRSYGQHASALLITYSLIGDSIPLQLSNTNDIVSGYDMYAAQELSLKFDLLGLKTASFVNEVCKLVGIKPEDINVESDCIYQFLNERTDFYGIFQFESASQGSVAQKIKPKNINQISDALAISRPGAMSFLSQYLNYVHKGEYQSINPIIDSVLKNTGGICLYQEQLLKMINLLGMPLDECEGLRKAIGKKLHDKIQEYKAKIYDVCEKNGHDKKAADLIWKIAEDSAGYQFNKSHSACYALLTARTIYLKVKYPLEFYLCALKMAKEEQEPQACIRRIQTEMQSHGISLLPPSIIKSDIDFSIQDGGIRFGLSSIKNVSDKTLEKLIKLRSEYATKIDLFEAAEQHGIDIQVLASLIRAGAMQEFGYGRSRLVLEMQLWSVLTQRERKYIKENIDSFEKPLDLTKIFSKLREGEKPIIKDKRFATIKEKCAPYKEIYLHNSKHEPFANYIYERRLLGYSYSQNITSLYKAKNPNIIEIKKLFDYVPGVECLFVGIIKEIKLSVSKKGTKYCRLFIEDDTGNVDVYIFNSSKQKIDRIEQCINMNGGELPKEDDIVIVKGTVKDGGMVYADIVSKQNEVIYMKKAELKEKK